MTEKEQDIIAPFFGENEILIVDANSSARVSLMGTLVQLGSKRHKMTLAGNLEEARAAIKAKKPKIVFSDFMIGKESGLDLFLDLRQEFGATARECLFILITGNVSQSAVASAAEEDVDSFIIKPYTLLTFKKCIGDALKAKLHPSEYDRLIQAGKDLMKSGELEEAEKKFKEAKKKNDKPALACFYTGQVNQKKSESKDADKNYREGLSHSKIHYKCLVGRFDLLMSQNKYEQAYDVVKKLAKYFPANPKRLATVLKLAIMTKNYDDIEGFYLHFTQMDTRTEELIRYVCAALAVTGKYYLANNMRSRGLELFDKLAVSSAGRIQFLRHAIESMVQHNCSKEAKEYLDRFPASDRGKSEYMAATLAVANATRPIGEVVQLGRDLLKQEHHHPTIYAILIKASAQAGLDPSAEEFLKTATGKWPGQTAEFTIAYEQGVSTQNEKKEAG